MSGTWSLTNTAAAGSAASVVQAASSGASGAGMQVRLRTLSASASLASTAGVVVMQVLDGATVIHSARLYVPTTGSVIYTLADVDLRASPGNNLTVNFAAGLAGCTQTVNAQGDFIPQGTPYKA